MKNLMLSCKLFLTAMLIYLSMSLAFSQTPGARNPDDNDALVRASLASYYLEELQEENYVFNTAGGEAAANIILKAYRNLFPIPNFSLNYIDAADKAKIEIIVSKLTQLRNNPPAWEEIVKKEEQYLIKWDKATRRTSKYK